MEYELLCKRMLETNARKFQGAEFSSMKGRAKLSDVQKGRDPPSTMGVNVLSPEAHRQVGTLSSGNAKRSVLTMGEMSDQRRSINS